MDSFDNAMNYLEFSISIVTKVDMFRMSGEDKRKLAQERMAKALENENTELKQFEINLLIETAVSKIRQVIK